MKLAELLNQPGVLYRHVKNDLADLLANNKSAKNSRKFTSFVRRKEHLKSEFGNRIISCNTADLPKTVKVVDIQYDLAWFT